jgi:hypothetical protein
MRTGFGGLTNDICRAIDMLSPLSAAKAARQSSKYGAIPARSMMLPSRQAFRTDLARTPLSRRAAAFAFALVIELLLLLALLKLGAQGPAPDNALDTKTFSINPAQTVSKERSAAAKPASASQPERQKEPPKEKKQIVSPRPPDPTKPPLVDMSSEDFAAADISKLPHGRGTAGGTAGKGAAYGPPGGGPPGNAQLFDADWYREPTRGELSPYFPAGTRAGWGLIACQTAPRYRVENCHALSDSPGSGLAQSLRRAAWQFQVIPPRIDGRPVIGAWVRIRFDLTEQKDRDESEGQGE